MFCDIHFPSNCSSIPFLFAQQKLHQTQQRVHSAPSPMCKHKYTPTITLTTIPACVYCTIFVFHPSTISSSTCPDMLGPHSSKARRSRMFMVFAWECNVSLDRMARPNMSAIESLFNSNLCSTWWNLAFANMQKTRRMTIKYIWWG